MSPSNVPSEDYLTIEVSPVKASEDATRGEPATALVPSWVLASDTPAKALEDCTITMEIGYVRKWFDFEKVAGAPINHICVPDPHYPFTPGGDGRQCRAVKTVAISPVKPGCEGKIQRKVVVWKELRTGNDLRRPDGTAFEDPDGQQSQRSSQALPNTISIGKQALNEMAKRGAEEPLDVGAESPASKKARIQDALEDELPPPPPEQDSVANGANGHTAADVAGLAGASAARQAELEKVDAIDQEEEAADDDNDEPAVRAQQRLPDQRYSDLYLDTISRKNLDFDFEKLCSVTLGNINVYACLVCGKYFAGRGPKTPAYFHALEIGHHVYIHMETKKVYVLPEGYEVKNKSLDDIKYVVDPKFSPEEVKSIDRRKPGEEEGRRESWDLWGKKYVPGFVGMNNIKANDYLNVVVQALAHVPPLRNFFLLEDFSTRPQLPQRFSTLVRKIWNPRAFKSHVSPHELIQEISLRSSKKFLLTSQADPIEFLSWFLNHLHLSLGGSRTKPQTSLIQKTFQGSLRVESQTITAHADATDRLRFEGNPDTIRSQTSPFLILTLDLPPAPLFQDGVEAKNI
ncbi:cysteine proteinase, partial [Hortaea werneckii]